MLQLLSRESISPDEDGSMSNVVCQWSMEKLFWELPGGICNTTKWPMRDDEDQAAIKRKEGLQ